MLKLVLLASLVACASTNDGPVRTGATDLAGGPIGEVWATSYAAYGPDELGWSVMFGRVEPGANCGGAADYADAILEIDTEQVETPTQHDVVLLPGDIPIVQHTGLPPTGTQADLELYVGDELWVTSGTLTITEFSPDTGMRGSLTAYALDHGLPVELTGTFDAPTACE